MNETWWVKSEQLDEDQRQIVELTKEGSYLITGPPGSGKTNLLLLRASYMLRAGMPNVLILVFNRTLQEFTRAGAVKYSVPPEQIKTCTSWEKDLLWEYAITPQEDPDFIVQRYLLLSQMQELVKNKKLGKQYDVILLDEAQDYLPGEIELFKELGKNIFAVADSRQQIYAEDSAIDMIPSIVDRCLSLKYHYRNSQKICKMADEIGKRYADYDPLYNTCNYDDASKPSTVEIKEFSDIHTQCGSIIDTVRIQLDAYPNELIGIIAPRKSELQEVWEHISATDLEPLSIYQSSTEGYLPFTSDTRICVCTTHSAKGLEFRALHIAGCEWIKRFQLQKNIAYTSITRAKTSLILYHTENLPGYLLSAYAAISPPKRLPELDELFNGDE